MDQMFVMELLSTVGVVAVVCMFIFGRHIQGTRRIYSVYNS